MEVFSFIGKEKGTIETRRTCLYLDEYSGESKSEGDVTDGFEAVPSLLPAGHVNSHGCSCQACPSLIPSYSFGYREAEADGRVPERHNRGDRGKPRELMEVWDLA